MLDKEVFATLLQELASYHKKEITPFVQRVWYKRLGYLTKEQFEQAIESAFVYCDFMPTPERVAELAGAGQKLYVLEQWERIEQGRKRYCYAPDSTKEYNELIASLDLDVVALKTLRLLGGLITLSRLSDQDIKWTRDKFIEYYQLWDARRDELVEEAEEIKALKAEPERLSLPPCSVEELPQALSDRLQELTERRTFSVPPQKGVGTTEEYQAIAQNLVKSWKAKEEEQLVEQELEF